MDGNGILISLIWAIALTLVLIRSNRSFSSGILTILFWIKIAGTFLLQWLFTYYYPDRSTADIYRFFDDGIILNQIFFDAPADFFKILFGWFNEGDGYRELYFDRMNAWLKPFDVGFYNDNQFMIRANAILAFVSFGFYEVHGVLFSFAAFQGLIWLCRCLPTQNHGRETALIIATLFPSSLIWMSGGLKETVAIFGLGAIIFSWLMRKQKQMVLLLLAGGFILALVKIYLLLLLVPALVFEWASRRMKRIPSLGIWMGIFVVGYILSIVFQLDIPGAIAQKQNDFLNHIAEINPGSAFAMDRLEGSLLDVILSAPFALATALFRPFVWEASSPAEWLMLLENIDILLLILCIVYFAMKKARLNWWPVLFALPVLVLAGLTTPVFGALMRYRAPVVVILFIFFTPLILDLVTKRLKT